MEWKLQHVGIMAESPAEEANRSYELYANTSAKPGKEIVLMVEGDEGQNGCGFKPQKQ